MKKNNEGKKGISKSFFFQCETFTISAYKITGVQTKEEVKNIRTGKNMHCYNEGDGVFVVQTSETLGSVHCRFRDHPLYLRLSRQDMHIHYRYKYYNCEVTCII